MLTFAINTLTSFSKKRYSHFIFEEFHIEINKMYKQSGLVLKSSLERWVTTSRPCPWSFAFFQLARRQFSSSSSSFSSPSLLLLFSFFSFLSVTTFIFEKIIRDGTISTWKVLKRGGDKGSIRFWVTAAVSTGLRNSHWAAKRGRTCKFPTIPANFYDFSDVRIRYRELFTQTRE